MTVNDRGRKRNVWSSSSGNGKVGVVMRNQNEVNTEKGGRKKIRFGL